MTKYLGNNLRTSNISVLRSLACFLVLFWLQVQNCVIYRQGVGRGGWPIFKYLVLKVIKWWMIAQSPTWCSTEQVYLLVTRGKSESKTKLRIRIRFWIISPQIQIFWFGFSCSSQNPRIVFRVDMGPKKLSRKCHCMCSNFHFHDLLYHVFFSSFRSSLYIGPKLPNISAWIFWIGLACREISGLLL